MHSHWLNLKWTWNVFSDKNRTPVTRMIDIVDHAVLAVTCIMACTHTWSNKQAISHLQYFNLKCNMFSVTYCTVYSMKVTGSRTFIFKCFQIIIYVGQSSCWYCGLNDSESWLVCWKWQVRCLFVPELCIKPTLKITYIHNRIQYTNWALAYIILNIWLQAKVRETNHTRPFILVVGLWQSLM